MGASERRGRARARLNEKMRLNKVKTDAQKERKKTWQKKGM